MAGTFLTPVRQIALVAAAGALSGCDLLTAPAPSIGPQDAEAARTAVPDLRPLAGASYADFVANPDMAAFTASGIGLSEPDRARLNQAMAESEPGFIASGGGVQALVFRGCAAPGCDAGRAVHAIDLASGDVFIGVSDAAGAEALAPNERIEALLRLSSPTRRWDDPAPAPGGGQP